MGVIDQILSGATGSAQTAAAGNPMATVQMVMSLINRFPGGMQGLLHKLSASGLQAQVQSWIGGGANQSVTGDQVIQALGSEHLQPVAQQFGVEQAQVANSLADLLPDVVDRLTPDGRADEGSLERGWSALKGRMPGL